MGYPSNGGPPLDDMEADDLDNSEFDRLTGLSIEAILREGQKALFARLVGTVRSGKASHQEMAILRNLLKDNGLTLGIPPEQPRVEEPPADFPDFGPPEE